MNVAEPPLEMLNVFQLMIARSVDWLTMTELVPAPLTVALPPTTFGPVGWVLAGIEPSASSAVEVINRVRRRGDIIRPSKTSGCNEEEPPVVAYAGYSLGSR